MWQQMSTVLSNIPTILFHRQTCFQIFLFVSGLPWQLSLINCTVLSETGSLLQWGDELSLTLWFRSIGFDSALCSLRAAAAWRKSIKTSQEHHTTCSPRPHWLHTRECDHKMQHSASMTGAFRPCMLITYLNQLFAKTKFHNPGVPFIFSSGAHSVTEYPVVLRPSQPHYEIVYRCQSLSRVRSPTVQCLMPVGTISPLCWVDYDHFVGDQMC